MDLRTIEGAWSELNDWVGQLTSKVQNMTIPPSTSHPATIGMCVAKNPANDPIAGPDYGTRYKTNGQCSIAYSDLDVIAFTAPSQKPAQQGANADQFTLPIQFGSFVMTGSFTATEPCSSYNLTRPNKLSAPSISKTQGTFTQTISNNTLSYVVNWTGSALAIVSIVVSGKPSVDTKFHDGMRSWFEDVGLVDYQMVSANLSGAFESAGFSQDMIALLTKAIAR